MFKPEPPVGAAEARSIRSELRPDLDDEMVFFSEAAVSLMTGACGASAAGGGAGAGVGAGLGLELHIRWELGLDLLRLMKGNQMVNDFIVPYRAVEVAEVMSLARGELEDAHKVLDQGLINRRHLHTGARGVVQRGVGNSPSGRIATEGAI
jgi:hypothetical protein